MFYFLSLYQQFVLGYSPLKTGVGYLTVVARDHRLCRGLAGARDACRRAADPHARDWSLLVLGMLWFTQIDTDGSYVVDLLPGYILAGVGLGFAFVPDTIAALEGVSARPGRDRLRADQHLAADRRRARRRHSHHRRRDANREPRPSGRPRPGSRAATAMRSPPPPEWRSSASSRRSRRYARRRPPRTRTLPGQSAPEMAAVADPDAREFLRKADPVLARLIDAHPGLPSAGVDRRAARARRLRDAHLPGRRPAALRQGDTGDPVPARAELRRTPAVPGRGARGRSAGPPRRAGSRLARARRCGRSRNGSSTGA